MTDLPRIAYLTSLYPAASHTFILREVTQLRALGFDVETCSMRRPDDSHMIGAPEREARDSTFYIIDAGKKARTLFGSIASALGRPGRLVKTIGLAWRTAPPGMAGFIKQMFYLAEAVVLSKHLRDQGIDHLHNHFADPSANVAMLTSALSDIPFSYTLHGPAELYEPEKWQLAEKTKRARFVACISHFARSQAMYFSDPNHWEKLHIIHCGVVPEHYAQSTTTPASDPSKTGTRFVFVGRLTPIKGLRVLLDAFEDVLTTCPDAHLTLVGDGDDRAYLETRSAAFRDAITFTGFLSQSDVADQLAQADVLVLPSFAEGLPVVLMEACAAAKPVICTQVAGVGELVRNDVSGFVVPAGDGATLAERMMTLAKDADTRARMGKAGRAIVAQDFDIRQEAARIATLFVDSGSAQIRPDPFERRS